MNPTLIKALICIILTLAAYSISVLTLSRGKRIQPLHLLLLWLAFCGNAAGSGLLKLGLEERSGNFEGLRGICIILSIVVIFIHAIWGTALVLIPDDRSKRIFLRDSKLVWKIWIVFFLLGIGIGFI